MLCAQPLCSQEPSCPSCTIRKLPVSFRHSQNFPLQNVSPADLEAKVHGKPVKILSLVPDPRPHRLVLILDASGSMGASITQKSGGEILTAAEWHGSSAALSASAEAKGKSEETLHRLYQIIVQDGLLEVELPAPLTRNERWELRFSSAARQRWKNAQITYPDTLLSCSAEVSGTGRN